MRFTDLFRGLSLRAVTFACVGLLAGLGVTIAAPAAKAQSLTAEVGSKTTVKLKDIPSLQGFLNSIGAGTFGNTDIVNATVTDRTISGNINMLAADWNFLLFKAGTAGTESIIAIEPKRTFKFSELFSNVPGMQLIDIMQFDRQVLVFGARESELKAADLPPAALAFFQPYFGSSAMDVKIAQGMTMYAALDLGKVAPLKSAIEFIGGKSSTVLLRGAMAFNILDSLSKKEKPVPSIQMAAALPTIRPTIGGKITLPVDFTIGLQSELSPTSVKLGYVADADFPFAYPNVATKRIDTARTKMGLEVSLETSVDNPLPKFAVNATLFKDAPFNKAFGIPFLSMENYIMNFEQQGDAIAVGLGASGRFYDKKIETFASAQVRATSAGLPIPQKIKFMVTPDNPTQIATLSLAELGKAFSDMTSVITGQNMPVPPIPDDFVKISGMRAGEGPFIDTTLDPSLDFGFEAAGSLVVFGKQIAEIDKAVIKPTHGIEIKAKSSGQTLGPITMPNAEVDVNLTVDNLSDPRVRIRGATQEILGSSGVMEININKQKQIGIMEGATPFKMFKATLIVESDTTNIREPNFSATGIIEGDWFNKLADGLTNATADLVKGTESVVSAMNNEIHTYSQKLGQAKIDKSKAVTDLESARRSANAAFDKAKADVNSLQGKYNSESGSCNGYPWNWGHCVAAGGLWVALQTANGVLDLAQKAVNGFLQGTGAALSKIIDGLNASISAFANAVDVASQAIGRAAVTFTKALDVAAKIAGKALDAVASVFDIEKLWMKGQLAILQGQQKGDLGIQYTLMSKEYIKSVGWDFKVPVDDIIKVFKPGSQGAPAAVVVESKYSYAPSTTQLARNISDQLLNEGTLKAVTVPFDPSICVKEPYAIDQQLADLRSELGKVGNLKLNAQLYSYLQAADSSPSFKAMMNNPNGSGPMNWQNPPPTMQIMPGVLIPSPQLQAVVAQSSGICHASYQGGVHPGQFGMQGQRPVCNITYAGAIIPVQQFEILVDNRQGVWVPAANGQVPASAFIGGQEPGRQLPVCRAQGVVGKVVAQFCNVGTNGRETQVPNYEVLINAVYSPAQRAGYNAIVASYRAGQSQVQGRDFTPQRVNDLKGGIQNISNAFNVVGAGDPVRNEMLAFINKPSTAEANLNVTFLTQQENDLNATIAALEKLKANPASPCGKAAQQAGVSVPVAPAPVNQAKPVANAQAAFQQVQAAILQQQNAILQALKLPGSRAVGGAPAPTDAQLQQTAAQATGTAFSAEAATAALALAQKQNVDAAALANSAKQAQQQLFVQKISVYKGQADQAAAANDKVEKRLDQIKTTLEVATPAQKQALAAQAQVAAAQASTLSKVNVVQPATAPRAAIAPGVVPKPVAQPGSRAVGGAAPAAQTAAVVFNPRPLMNLPPAVRDAFARQYAADQAKATAAAAAPAAAAGAPGARAIVPPGTAPQLQDQLVKSRAASVQAMQASPSAKALPANLAPAAVLASEDRTDVFAKAALLQSTNRTVGRQSQIPGAPDSVATQASTLTNFEPVANVNSDYLGNSQILRGIPR
ncbi:MAG TPA: DM9 repeat-containing protein [Alphaproteobacteria bacterium]|jgi:hypothetical protein